MTEPSFTYGNTRVEADTLGSVGEEHMGKERLSLLGNGHTEYPTDYAPELLETFDNKHPGRRYVVTFQCPEFTSLCPITGQPDFARIVISYIPRVKMVESKSLKLYLFSFRNHGDFHEDCVNIILNDLRRLMEPLYIEVLGIFTPRGGIAIHPFANWADPDDPELLSLAATRRAQQLAAAMNCTFNNPLQ